MSNSLFYGFIGAFLIGVAGAEFLSVSMPVIGFLILLAGSCFTLFFWHRLFHILLASFLLFAMTTGLLYVDLVSDDTRVGETFIGQTVTIRGVITDAPDEREKSTRLIVSIKTVNDVVLKKHERALIITERFPTFHYGDRVQITGRLDQPESFVTDTGRIFDYVSFLQKDDIYYTLLFPELVVTDTKQGHPVKSVLFAVRETFLAHLAPVVPDPQFSLLGGILVGAKESLGSHLQDVFRKTGIIHIVVLSGYNVTIVADAIMKAVGFLPRLTSLALGASSIVLFALLTGAGATVVRASIMALLVLVARATGRTYAITRALFLAAFLMVLHNPDILLHDPSFQLSFLASIGLIHLAPKIETLFSWLPEKFALRQLAAATIATQLFVLPLLLYMTGELSLVALPVNLLILPIIPITMLFGFIAGIIAWVIPTIVMPFALVTTWLLSYIFVVVDFFAAWPLAAVILPLFPFWIVLLLYVPLLWLVLRKKDACV